MTNEGSKPTKTQVSQLKQGGAAFPFYFKKTKHDNETMTDYNEIMTNHCVDSLVFVIVGVWKTIFLSASFNDGCLR